MAVTFLPIQQGSGDPSPTNVRPIVAPLNITGIGEIWGGSFDTFTGTLIETHDIADLGNCNWTYQSANTRFFSSELAATIKPPVASDAIVLAFCSKYKYESHDWLGMSTENNACAISTTKNVYIKDISYTDSDLLKESLEGVQFIYPLATPITHTLTPAQYAEACQQLHIPNPATELLMQRTVIGNPHIEAATGSIAAFNTDMKAPLKQLKCEFTPVQNLNGYSNPWPAGGGKNLFNDANYTSGTLVPVHATIGTTIAVSAKPSNDSIQVKYYDINQSQIDYWTLQYDSSTNRTGKTFSIINSDCEYIAFVSTGELSQLQVEINSSITSYEPYENVCPISGWTRANVTRCGVNLWDEEWEVGGIDNSTGGNTVASDIIRSKNYIPVHPSISINCVYPYSNNNSLKLCLYDKDKQYIDYIWRDSLNHAYTLGANVYYLRFVMRNTYGTTYNNDISINYPSTDTDYHAYTGSTYAISFPVTKNLLNPALFTNYGWNEIVAICGMPNVPRIPDGSLILQAGTYTISRTQKTANWTECSIYNSNGDIIASRYSDRNYLSFTLTESQAIGIYISVKDTDAPASNSEIQLEVGSTATPYEPYGTIYGGYIDFVKNVAVASKAYVLLNNPNNWRDTGSTTVKYRYMTKFTDRKLRGDSITGLYCSIAPCTYASNIYGRWTGASEYYFGIYDGNNVLTLETIQTLASNGSIAICYDLATPIEYPLTPQLLKSLKGVNTIFTDLNGPTTVKYWTH